MKPAFPQYVRYFLGCVLLAAIGSVSSRGATLERLTMDDLITKSTAIVRGTVTGSYAAFHGRVIYTHYAVQVAEQLKGSNSSTVDLVVPGGTANNLRQVFAGTPEFHNGDQFVFFLWTGPSGLTQIMGLTQGLFQISSSSNMVTRATSSELMLDPRSGRPVKDEPLTMSLSDLRARIARGLAETN